MAVTFSKVMKIMKKCYKQVRENRQPFLVHAKVPFLNHHTSGVRKEFYRSEEDLALHANKRSVTKIKKAAD